ncbi:MAG: type II toxin-antitoxin system RelE/ParE family toxin [Negativicutes bacterium]|jgi:addiction module RelE/StbE family toxin
MQNKYALRITHVAEADIEDIFAYIFNSLSASGAAKSLIDKIHDSIIGLCEYPFAGSMVDDEVLRMRGYRKIIVERYIVLYRVNDNEQIVTIMRVIFGARNYLEIL